MHLWKFTQLLEYSYVPIQKRLKFDPNRLKLWNEAFEAQWKWEKIYIWCISCLEKARGDISSRNFVTVAGVAFIPSEGLKPEIFAESESDGVFQYCPS